MRKLIIAALTALAFSAPLKVEAQNVVVSPENLKSVLSGYHEVPEEDYWRRLEPEQTRASLIDIANDEKVFTLIRARALFALTYFTDDQVAALLADTARSDSIAYMRVSAIDALFRARGEKAVDTFIEKMKDEETIVRLAAIRSLQRIGAPEARAALESSLGEARNKSIGAVIDNALRTMR